LAGIIPSSLLPLLVSLFCYSTHVILQGLHSCSSEIAEKEDIYQLGVILLEFITGQLTTSASEVNDLKLQVFIQLFTYFVFVMYFQIEKEPGIHWLRYWWFSSQLELGLAESASQLRAATDPSFQGTFAYQSLKTTVGITLNCLCKDPSKRPSIEDVLWNLQYSIQVQEGWTSSGNLSTQM
jgi:serine/threonine protein kinase